MKIFESDLKLDWEGPSELDWTNKDLERLNRYIALRIENRRLMKQWSDINAIETKD